jgi:hypothetical protein
VPPLQAVTTMIASATTKSRCLEGENRT